MPFLTSTSHQAQITFARAKCNLQTENINNDPTVNTIILNLDRDFA